MGNCEDKGESCSVSQVPEEIKLFLYGWRKTKDLRVDPPLPANGRSAGLKCQVPLGHLWPQSLNIITQKRVDNLHYQSSIIVSSRKQGELPETSQQSWSETPQHFRRIWGSMTTKAWLTPEIKRRYDAEVVAEIRSTWHWGRKSIGNSDLLDSLL